MEAKTLIEFAEDEAFDELRLPPLAFEELEKAPGWVVLTRVMASWISLRRDLLEDLSIADQEGRDEFKKLQGEIGILRCVLELPKALEIDSGKETKDEQ